MGKTISDKQTLKKRDTGEGHLLPGRWVGREAELDKLQQWWEQAQEQGKLVLVSGPGGIGKARLLEELGTHVGTSGAGVARGQCVASGRSAYRPWREVLRTLLEPVERVNVVLMKRIGPVLAALLPELWERPYMAGLAQPAGLDPLAAQQRLNSAIVRLLRAAAEIRPTLIVINNAHRADEASLALLAFLGRIPRPAGLLVSVTWCDEGLAPEHPLLALPDDQTERITLSPLPPEATADLARSMLGLNKLPASLIERLQRAAGGNPLFTQELIRAWAEEGAILRPRGDGWRVDETALQKARLPESLPQVMALRLARLSPEALRALRGASVMGPVFWDGCVEAVGQLSKPQAHAALEVGLDKAWLIERTASAFEGEREYTFASATVGEVCYASIPPEEQNKLHGRAAAWLTLATARAPEGHPGDSAGVARGEDLVNEHLGLIAEHLDKAGQTEQAVEYLRRAGEQAAALFANTEAVAYLSRALEITPEGLSPEYYAVLLIREKVYDLRGAREAQLRDLVALQKLAEMMNDDRRRAEVALRQAHYADVTGDYPASMAAAQAAIRLAQATRDVSQEAAGYMQWGRALWHLGDYEATLLQLKQALTLARSAGLRQVEADSLLFLGVVSHYQGNHAEAIAFSEQAFSIYREVGDRQGEIKTLNSLGFISASRGDYAGGRAYFELALRISREIGDWQGEGMLLDSLGLLLHQSGNNQVAWECSQQALIITQEIGDRRMQGYALNTLGHALAGLGRLEEAADAYQRALALRREMGQQHLVTETLAGLADVSLAQENIPQAQAQVEEILNHLASHTLDGTQEPFRIYMTCYRVLSANRDPRAKGILDTAYHLLQEQAANITDEEMRRSFLENVAAHREILHEFAGRQPPQAADKQAVPPIDKPATARRQISRKAPAVGRLPDEETLWEGEKPFRAIAETASDAIIILDADENIFFWNQAAQDIFGYWAGETKGHLLASILTPDFCQAFRKGIEQVVTTGRSDMIGRPIEVIGVRQDGSQFPLELSLSTWKTKDKALFTAIGRDVTERKRAEQALQQAYAEVEQRVQERTAQLQQLNEELDQRVAARTERLETVAVLSGQLNAILDLDRLLDELVNQVKERFNYYHTQIYLVDDTRNQLILTASYGQAGARMMAEGYHFSLDAPAGLVPRAAREGTCIIVEDVWQEPTWKPNPFLPDTQTELAAPIMAQGKVVGVLDVQSDRKGGLDEGDVNLLRSLANQAAVAITNARLFEQAQQRAVELTKAKEAAEAAKDEADQARKEAEIEKEKAQAAKEEADQARRDTEAASRSLAVQMWQTAGQALLNERIRGEQDIPTLARNVVQQLCEYLDAQVGMLYVREEDALKLSGAYAYRRQNLVEQFQMGEGMVGEAALSQRTIIVNVPDDYIAVAASSLGELMPKNVLFAPFVYEGQSIGVIEIGALAEFTQAQKEFLHKALESVAIAFTTAQTRARINELLAKTRHQAEELQAQEEELRATNEELEAQAENLRDSESKLKANQAQLEATNVELEEKAAALQEQQVVLDRQNQELRAAQQELERRAEELARASKYKSEFLANMSHELRTPLNSLLILAGLLSKNEEGNLTPDQVESAQIIYSGGTDLLNLINDILDLAKVEAGKMEFRVAPMPLSQLVSSMRSQFTPLAEKKGLEFEITLAEDAPGTIETDQQRVEQIVKNLLSNAMKFTEQGSVRLDISRPTAGVDLSQGGLDPAQAVAICVTDTGIGMTPEQQKIVFEAFQQADGSTSRQYGGTGLGLSISRELSMRLGGKIDLVSELGKGSTFTLYLPVERKEAPEQGSEASEATGQRPEARARSSPPPSPSLSAFAPPIVSAAQPAAPSLPDDRDNVQGGDRVLLVIEDDDKFAKIVYDYAHKRSFKCLVAGDGETGLKLAKAHKADAIVLDLNLPGMSGWEVLDMLKHNPDTRHIPVHIMSVVEEDLDAYRRGAMGFLTKPISQEDLQGAFQRIEEFIARKIKTLLLVEDDASLRKSVRKLLEGNDVAISEVGLGQAALELLASQRFDCMILDLNLPDMSGFELLSRLDGDDKLPKCPVIVYTGKALTEEENHELLKYADSVIVKGAKSPERLLDETALFLHRVIAHLPEEKQRTLKRLMGGEAALAGKVILIVDDDARNALALSKLLADKGLQVHIAASGQKALELLDKTPVDLVLMDIMLPGMDGYEVTQRIRAQARFRSLPILALTAKAMKGDREKCIAAGANDYLAKPVDADRLFSMLRVWLSRE